MKVCTKCGCEKPKTDFYKDSRKSDGLRSWCKVCQKEDNCKRESHYNETRKKYRLEHKDEYREKKKQYYQDNKQKVLTGSAAWRQTFNGRLASYKRAALKRNITWELTDEEFKSFWQKDCAYCGESISTIGIDRKNNLLGYTIENCQSCCSVCNTMKLKMKENDFINQIIKIYGNISRN